MSSMVIESFLRARSVIVANGLTPPKLPPIKPTISVLWDQIRSERSCRSFVDVSIWSQRVRLALLVQLKPRLLFRNPTLPMS